MFTYEEVKSLNELEVLIYNYVVSNSKKVSGMTVRKLAEELHVSTTSILRFCGKMGCEGYSEFKYKLKEYMKESEKKEMVNDYTIILDFFKKIENKDFDLQIQKAAEMICAKNNVFFIGMGTSGTLGKYGARYLSNLGKGALYLDDPFYPTEHGRYDDAVVVALSVSGEQRYLYRQIDGFKKKNAQIISITNTHQCTLAGMSDLNIAYYMPMIVLPGLYNVTSQVPVMYILETLAHRVQRLNMQKNGLNVPADNLTP